MRLSTDPREPREAAVARAAVRSPKPRERSLTRGLRARSRRSRCSLRRSTCSMRPAGRCLRTIRLCVRMRVRVRLRWLLFVSLPSVPGGRRFAGSFRFPQFAVARSGGLLIPRSQVRSLLGPFRSCDPAWRERTTSTRAADPSPRCRDARTLGTADPPRRPDAFRRAPRDRRDRSTCLAATVGSTMRPIPQA